MNVLKHIIYGLIFAVLLLQSCSVEKRHYTSGYHLQWKKHNSIAQNNKTRLTKDTSTLKVKDGIVSIATFNALTACVENKKGIVLLSPDSNNCDTLIMRDETEIKVKVIEITPTEIKYKYCNHTDGPTYVAYRYNVSYIKYANGSLDSFVKEHASVNNTIVKNTNVYNNNMNTNSSYSQDMDNYRTERYVRKKSVASIVFGVCAFIPFYGAPAAIFAIIYGAKSLSLINKDPKSLFMYKQKATIGLILGSLALLIYLLLLVFAVLLTLGII